MPKIEVKCCICKKKFLRYVSPKFPLSKTPCCNRICAGIWLSKRMIEMNEELNPDRMRLETRKKISKKQKDKKQNSGKTYEKTLGKHTHRIVAEKKLGRKLKPGEIVHHKDENKRNNDPNNIEVFKNQAEHARHHTIKNKGFKKKNESKFL